MPLLKEMDPRIAASNNGRGSPPLLPHWQAGNLHGELVTPSNSQPPVFILSRMQAYARDCTPKHTTDI